MTNPIAGTRPRGKTKREDEEIAKELLDNEKERAEHMMLVDLGRNDIGRVSEIGSVTIDKYMKVENTLTLCTLYLKFTEHCENK